MKLSEKKSIVIFASGNGTNAQNIIEYFFKSEVANVVYVLSNNKNAKVLERAKAFKIKTLSFTKDELKESTEVFKLLKKIDPDIIVLAGFLLKIPEIILQNFPKKIINIHPSLLPKYGGKGMYGNYVHEAVMANKETETGITVHYVTKNYDEGAIIFQEKVSISPNETIETITKKIHSLEYKFFPKVIEELLAVNEDGNSNN